MVRHIVAWNFADTFTEEENKANAQTLKSELEGLKDLIEGIEKIELLIRPLDTSNSELMLDSVFISEEALKAYQVHPEHVRVAGLVKQMTKNRKCLDFFM